MYTIPLQFSDVIYNAANQTFEALVTVHDRSRVRRYACAIAAPIQTEFEDAARSLARQALRRHERGELGSIFSFAHPQTVSRAQGASTIQMQGARAA